MPAVELCARRGDLHLRLRLRDECRDVRQRLRRQERMPLLPHRRDLRGRSNLLHFTLGLAHEASRDLLPLLGRVPTEQRHHLIARHVASPSG